MAKKYNSILGVDIGSQTIKIAEVRLQGRQPAVTALGMAQTPEGAVDHIGVHDSDSVGQVLKQLCAASGVSVGDVVVSMAGQGSVLVRTLEVPNMNDSELKQHMDWEITRNIPFAESTVVSDFKAFPPETAGAQNMDVVMAIAPQSAVDLIVDLVKKAGKKTAALDVEPLGLARSLAMSYESDLQGKNVCVVEIGHKTTSINIYRDGKLLMPRQVPLGGEMFTRAIADTMNVSFEEAEHMKHTKGEVPANAAAAQPQATFNPFDTGGATQQFAPYNPFADASEAPAEGGESTGEVAPAPEPEAPIPAPVEMGMSDEATRIYNAMAGILDEFTAEVRRSIDYYRSKGGEVDVIMLCGGGSKLKNLASFLETAVGLPSSMMDPLKNITMSAKKMDDSADDTRNEFAVAVGNGLHICF